jgi:hypothetical protein
MLKGKSTLQLTHETVRVAVEQYLQAGLTAPGRMRVTGIEAEKESRTYGASSTTFTVQIEEVETPAA